MAISFPRTTQGRWPRISWPWLVTIGYLVLMLFIPTAALIGKSLTTTPSEFWRIATDPVALSAYEISVVTSLGAALLNGPAGLLIAWVLVRYDFPGRRYVDALVDLPFALPTSVAGLTLATVYSEKGWLGSLLAPLGIKVAFTRWGVFVALVFISLPFVVRTVQPLLQEIQSQPEFEEAAWCLGASQSTTFWRVIFPPLLPALITGMVLGFARAVGEFGSVVIIAAGVAFQDLIAPVLVFQRLEQYDYTGATIIGTVLLLISLSMILVVNALQAWERRYEE